MSCIVGFIENGDIYMGADSACVDVSNLSVRVIKEEKIFYKGKFLIGVAGSVRVAQIVKHSFIPPEKNPDDNDFGYMCSTFVGALSDILTDNECIQVNDGETLFNGEILVGYNGKLYHICSDKGVTQIDNYDAIGCATDFAIAAMYTACLLSDTITPLRILSISLQVAENYSVGVRGPFIFKVLRLKNDADE